MLQKLWHLNAAKILGMWFWMLLLLSKIKIYVQTQHNKTFKRQTYLILYEENK